ncbi:gamma-glutamyltransferase, partial [Wohlfahrtiimonas larvae]
MVDSLRSLLAIGIISASGLCYAQVNYGVEGEAFHPIFAKQGMVVSQEPLATQIGLDILKNGGNAIDAAVAVGYALAVTHPQAGNIGGGGFMLIHLADGQTTAIDFREVAPNAASRNMYLDENGNIIPNRSLTSLSASGVPGTVAGLSYALEKYGSQSPDKILNPA